MAEHTRPMNGDSPQKLVVFLTVLAAGWFPAMAAAAELSASTDASSPEALHARLAGPEGSGTGRETRELIESVGRLDQDLVMKFLRSIPETTEGLRDRDSALRMLGVVARADDIRLLVRTAVVHGDRVPRQLADPFRVSLQQVLTREHGAAVAGLFREIPGIPVRLFREVVLAVDGAMPRATPALAVEVLRRRPDAAGMVFPIIDRIVSRLTAEESNELGRLCLELLDARSPIIRQLAASAVGTLGTSDAFERLIGLLEDEQRGVRHAAHGALRAISGLDLRKYPARWRLWYGEEQSWFDTRADRCYASLGSDDRKEVAEALREISHRRLYRKDRARRVADLLLRDDKKMLRLTLASLHQIGSTAAVPALVEALETEVGPLRNEIGNVLRSLTGENLPAEPGAWRRWLDR